MQNQNKSLSKGLMVLKKIMNANQPITANTLCSLLEIDKSTMSRLITTLMSEGFIEYVNNTKEIVLTDIFKTASEEEKKDKLIEKTSTLLDEIFYLTDECSYLCILDDNAALNLNQIDKSNRVLKTRDSIGLHSPLHTNAFGKILCAFDVVELNSLNLKPYTKNTITTLTKLKKEIETIRQVGYAIGFEEYEFGLFSIAVPYFNNKKEFVATVGISGLSARVDKDKCHEIAKKIFNLVNPTI